MLHGVFDQGLEYQWWYRDFIDIGRVGYRKAKPVAKSQMLNLQITPDEIELFAKWDNRAFLIEDVSKHGAKLFERGDDS